MAHEEQDYIDGWQIYSDWIDDLRDDSEVITDEYDNNLTFRQNFMSCPTNYERFKLIWTDARLRSELKSIYMSQFGSNPCKFVFPPKSSSESDKFRNAGNRSFKNGQYLEALRLYTRAICLAPLPTEDIQDKSLALAFANRSAAAFKLKRHRSCLVDIEAALKYGYPKENHFKVLVRKMKCLHILSVWSNDLENIKSYLRDIVNNPETKEFVKTEIQNMFEFIAEPQNYENDKDDVDVVDDPASRITSVNKVLPQAADCIDMSYSEEKGRYLITTKNVIYGRLLISERPFVCNLATSKRKSYCYNCCARLNSWGLSCPNCTQVLYCSEGCLESNYDIHSHECNNFLVIQNQIGVAYLVAHIMFKMNFDFSDLSLSIKKSQIKKSLDEILKMTLCDWTDFDFKNDYTSILSLMDHFDELDYDAAMGFNLTAGYLVTAFVDRFKDKTCLSDLQNQLLIGSLVTRHLQQLQSNLISILDQDLQSLMCVGRNLTDIKERPIGIGLYPTISLLNHSCSPNIMSLFCRNKFLVRASKNLDCGVELNYCYGPNVNRMSKKDRQRRLKDQYFFTCECQCCSKNIEAESRALLCPECGGPVIYDHDQSSECSKCHSKNNLDVRSALESINQFKSRIHSLRNEDIDPKERLRILRSIEEALKKIVYRCHSIFMDIKTDLISYADAIDDIESALKYSEEELELCAEIFGKDSYESILTRLKYINFKWQSLKSKMDSDEISGDLMEELKTLSAYTSVTRSKLKDILAATNIMGAESSYDTELKFLGDTLNAINRCTQ